MIGGSNTSFFLSETAESAIYFGKYGRIRSAK